MYSTINDLKLIFMASVKSVSPGELIRKNVKLEGNKLVINNKSYNLNVKNVYVIGFGKAVQKMGFVIEQILKGKLKHGIINIPYGTLDKNHYESVIKYYEGAKNNLPDENSVKASKLIKNLIIELQKDDFLLVLISGGGSALLSLPHPDISLEEKVDIIKKLSNSGADIKELNIVRQKLSDLKGGKLAYYAQPAKIVSLILSDVIDDPLSLIASGPTVYNPHNYKDAEAILKKFNVFNNLSHTVKNIIKTEDIKEFPHENVTNVLIGSNTICLKNAHRTAEEMNYKTFILSNNVSGDVLNVAKQMLELTKLICKLLKHENNEELHFDNGAKILNFEINRDFVKALKLNSQKGFLFICGGETTVKVLGNGKGGRNQHLSLEFARLLNDNISEFDNFEVILLCGGTDGIDGPTDAAGGIAYKHLVRDAVKQNIQIEDYLNNSNSYNFYDKFSNGIFHLKVGHTHTNVMDIYLLYIGFVEQ